MSERDVLPVPLVLPVLLPPPVPPADRERVAEAEPVSVGK